MDDALSRLMPTQKIGNDGFSWWIGQVEGTASDEKNNKGGYRFKVRIVGDHPQSRDVLGTDKLPWANVMMPVNVPFMPGNIGGAHPQLIPGCWVTGFFLDNDRQKPIIMGSVGVVPGATSTINNCAPDDNEAFKTCVRSGNYAPNPYTDGLEGKDGTAKTGGGLSDGTTIEETEEKRVDEGLKKQEVIKDEDWCQTIAEKCDDVDLKTQTKNILSQFLYDVQNSNGNIGTFYTDKVTGEVNDSLKVARKYVNKLVSVITEFLGKIKGYITSKIQEAVEKLVKAVLAPNETGNVLTPVTEWFNKILKDLGCQMADLGDRLISWLTNLLMNYVMSIYRAAICQVDELVNGIISKIQQLMSDLLTSILGPLQDILGAIAEPLNLIGNAINYILRLLGISCSGPDKTCAKYKEVCTSGEKKEKGNDKDFLDELLEDISNLFGDTPSDYTQYVCEEAYTGQPLAVTTIGFIGGVPLPPDDKPKIIYNIDSIEVTEGETAKFTVTRTGLTEIASSVEFKTLKNQGTATAETDYLVVDDILGFAPGETEKPIEVQTFKDDTKEFPETFFVRLTTNSPVNDSEVITNYINNIGKCTILEKELKEPYDPYIVEPVDPFTPIDDAPTDTLPTNPNVPDDGTGDDGTGDSQEITYAVTANRPTCPEGEFIIYTITTTNLSNGSIAYYNLTGGGITALDIIGNQLSGSFIINDNSAKVTVGIAEDNKIEDVETLTFSITGQGASVDVLITTDDDLTIDDFDNGLGDVPETTPEPFRPPTAKPPITDDNGGIIEIPVDNPGSPWAEPPIVFVGGEGSGATAVGLLDGNGFLTEIRVRSSGFGYKLNRASDNDVRCIIDSFTIRRPGIGYTSVPDMYVNGELGVAEAIIDFNTGFVIGARILNREITFDRFPAVDIVGGGGYGARLLPSLACLDTDALSTIGSTKIGTGKYIDCP